MTTIVLLSVVLSALAGGVLAAYAVCLGMFQVLRIHSAQVALQRKSRAAEAPRAVATGSLAG